MPSLKTSYHYIRFSVSPPTSDALKIRKTVQDALMQSFGLVAANTYMDVLWLAEDGSEIVLRVGESDASNVMVAVTTSTSSPRLSVTRESPFLPSLLASNINL
ncbi:hypothetical protein EIP91_011990 [Steccherinum ochraceum]|uniref:Ribonucleases P/MRP subunit Pop8-like domain-containing protein n=1 Tax=Steccherinum ochraceum TaxID=92696 RepID=A0A4R0RVA0_9APHY|nr:hypothetical protein EIP91_011990 [Steccherinum ochraceum]